MKKPALLLGSAAFVILSPLPLHAETRADADGTNPPCEKTDSCPDDSNGQSASSSSTTTTTSGSTQVEGLNLGPIYVTAEEQAKQALGSSVITSEQLEDTPVTNDISEIVRKMPGVNYTATATNGRRGNQRQIDIRGMGSENTLILIDGKPVTSRYSVRMSHDGSRDTRGDSNWVPANLIERIEVLRGPAAARYGSGAAGGVVNIITKKPKTFTGEISLFYNLPEDSAEGDTRRATFMVGGPIKDDLTFRLSGSYNLTEGDDVDINEAADSDYSGMEGVENRDFDGLLSWELDSANTLDFEAAYSKQENRYSGDFLVDASSKLASRFAELEAMEGETTNKLSRRTYSITHTGNYSFGTSKSFIQWEHTDNWRLLEGDTGSIEGLIDASEGGASIALDNVTAKSEWSLPLKFMGIAQNLTLGAEYRGEWLDDGYSSEVAQDFPSNLASEIDVAASASDRSGTTDQTTVALYTEDNIQATDRLTLTPGLRVDYNSNYEFNFSPSLNAYYKLTDKWQTKVGIARAFKSPGLFQLDPNYVYYTRGGGCPTGYSNCYIIGNEDLKPETSTNTEFGFSYDGLDNGVSGTLTYFYNNYRNRISADSSDLYASATSSGTTYNVFQWTNIPKAVVSGLEGSFSVPLGYNFTFSANATYMFEAKDKTNDEPLSLTPEYTVNAFLEWKPRFNTTVTLSSSSYGKTEAEDDDEEDLDPYTLVDLSLTYRMRNAFTVMAGVKNVFDKVIYRTNEGANTYNVDGRSFYLGLTKSF